jgi:hypothetical protein
MKTNRSCVIDGLAHGEQLKDEIGLGKNGHGRAIEAYHQQL